MLDCFGEFSSYAKQPRFFVDPMELEDDTVIEAVDSKVERFLIKLKYQIQKSNYENIESAVYRTVRTVL